MRQLDVENEALFKCSSISLPFVVELYLDGCPLWNKHDFLVGQIKRMTTIPTRGKNAHPLFDWKISKTNYIRLVVNSFVCSLDCENSTKISNKMFRSRKYTVLDSFQFVQKIPATPSSEGILLLDDKIL